MQHGRGGLGGPLAQCHPSLSNTLWICRQPLRTHFRYLDKAGTVKHFERCRAFISLVIIIQMASFSRFSNNFRFL